MTRRVLVVGAGWFAGQHLAGWRAAEAEPVALCDLDAARAARLAAEHGIATTGQDAVALMERLKPDLVDVVLPAQAQAEVVRQALQRGIPTVCQKPFGRDWAEANALAAAARQAGVPLVVHENFRFAPWFREARRLIDAGTLGRLHGVSFRLRPGDGQGPRAYLDRQPYFQSMPQLLVRETAVHFIDSFRYLCGEVQAVTARLRRLNPVIAGEDAALIVFEFADACTGLFDGNRLNDHTAQDPRRTMGEMWLEGSAGVLRLDGDGRLWFKPHHGPEQPHPCPLREGAFGGAVTALQAHVLAQLDHGAPLENSATDYLANLRVQAAVYHSHTSGRRIEMAAFGPAELNPTTTAPSAEETST
jgi:D-apiose dehydrogenase